MPRFKYGLQWSDAADDLTIEMACIKKGGRWDGKDGKRYGLGLPQHYEAMRRILWPNLDGEKEGQRWHVLCRNEILRNKVTVLLGPGSSGKTHSAAWVYLCEYFCYPEDTCILVSSTDIRGLELRVWGEMKTLFQQAIDRFPYLPGHLIDSKHAIATDNLDEHDIDEKRARDFRKGIIGIPCVQNGKFIGLGKYSGIKQKHMRLIADEAQFMGASFLSAFANLDKNEDFRAVVLGNPNDILDPLGKAAEPLEGWGGHMEPTKTEVWRTRFMGGRCVNLIGTDSPNFDFPQDQPTRFPYLISREKIANTLSFFPQDSSEYMSQCVGAMKVGILARRVITRDLCRQFHAFDKLIWSGAAPTKVFALDAAYGGDRCVGGHIEFGPCVDGKIRIIMYAPQIVPISVKPEKIAEDQIADWVKEYCGNYDIPPENVFHDSTGRGSLGTSLARLWSAQCNPVEFGGSPTDRPVSLDLYITDPETHQRRLKLCSEHYSKFVTELWFAVRYAIEADQLRGLTEEVMEEGCMREWDKVNGDKIEIESKKDMKLRVGRSPDLFDWLSIAVEGARRLGFMVAKLGGAEEASRNLDWLETLALKNRAFHRRHQLTYSA